MSSWAGSNEQWHTREAIEDYLRLSPYAAAEMTAGERAEVVREHLSAVITSVRRKLDAVGYDADVIVIRSGELQA